MKKTLAISLSLCATSLSAQIALQNNAPRIGDVIIKQQVVYKDPGRQGENVLWDFSKLELINNEYELSYQEPYNMKDSINIMGSDTVRLKKELNHNELFQGIEHYTSYYYRLKNDTLYCMGHENPTTLLHYKQPLPVMLYPLQYGQKTRKNYHAEGLYSNGDSILTYGSISLEFDAMGKMILPSKDTLEHVMRIKKVQTIKKDSIERIGQQPMNTVMETCQWYSKGYRYPVFETVRTIDRKSSGDRVFFATAFFYPPQEHYYLEDDDENLAILDSIASGNTDATEGEIDPKQWLKDNFMYNFYPNPVATNLHVEYHLVEGAEVGLSLYSSVTGISRQIPVGMKPAGYYSETFDCSGFPSGSYVLSFHVRGETVSSVILKR